MSEFERQHPIAAVTRLASVLRQNIIPLIILLVYGLSGTEDNYNLIAIGIGIVFAFVYGILSWWYYRFRIVDAEIQIQYGVFVKKKLYLNQQRIQVIDITEGIIQRAFGLVQMEIKTAGSGTERASISAISRERALEIKAQLSSKKIAYSDGEEIQELSNDTEVQATWRLDGKELVYAALTSGSFGLIASIIGGISSQMNQFLNEDNINFVSNILPGLNDILLIVTIVAILILISWVLSFIAVLIQYMDFKVERMDNDIVITRGLFERKHITLPYDRIQAVKVVEGFLRMPFNRAMIYIESAGFQQQKSKSVVVVPLIRKSEIPDFLNTFLAGYHLEEVSLKPPSRAFFRYLRRPVYLPLLITIPLFFFVSNSFAWFIIAIVPLIFLAYRSYHESGVFVGNSLMVVVKRFFNRSTIMVKKPRIQVAEIKKNPFQIRKNLASFDITVASGHTGVTFDVKDLDEDDASQLLKWAVPGFIPRPSDPE